MDDDSGAPPPDDQDEAKPDPKKRVREPTEGVRLIGAEEAAEAAGRHDVVSRIPDDVPKFGDRPAAPPGASPTDDPAPVRLPSPDDPNTFGAVPIISPDDPPPPGLGGVPPDDETTGLGPDDEPTATIDVPAVAPEQAADEDELSRILGGRRDDTSSRRARRSRRRGRRGRDESGAAEAGDDAPRPSAPTGEVELPHWTKPATGEVPQVVAGESADFGAEGDEKDLDVWAGLSSTPRWRDQGEDSTDDFSDLAGDTADVGDLADAPPPPPPPMEPQPSFDDLGQEPMPGVPTAPIEPEPEPEPSLAASSPYPEARRGEHPLVDGEGRQDGGGGAGRDLPQAIIVGVGLALALLILSLIGTAAVMVLVLAVIVMAAAEFFGAVRRVGYHPVVLVGLAGTASMVLAVHWKGEAAFPIVTFLVVAVLMLWYVIGLAHERAVANIGVTLFGVMWIGGLGSFAALLLALPHGIGLLWGAVVATVAYDVGGLVVGRQMGNTPLSPASPNKTVEGLLGGAGAAVVVSVIFGAFGPFPWELADGLVLGLAVAIVAPAGDLCESMLKRDLGIKDMGTILPGHGGLLDRFDALLFVLPATYYVVRLLDVLLNTP